MMYGALLRIPSPLKGEGVQARLLFIRFKLTTHQEKLMAERIDRDELIRLVSQRTGVETDTVVTIVEAFLDEIYQAIRRG